MLLSAKPLAEPQQGCKVDELVLETLAYRPGVDSVLLEVVLKSKDHLGISQICE